MAIFVSTTAAISESTTMVISVSATGAISVSKSMGDGDSSVVRAPDS